MQKNEELERINDRLKKSRKGGEGQHTPTGRSNSDPYNSRADGSYDDQDRSFNDNSFSNSKAQDQGNRALLEQMMEEKTQMQMALVSEEQKAMQSEQESQKLRSQLHEARDESRQLTERLNNSVTDNTNLQAAAKEQLFKYNKVKKALFSMKDKATKEISEFDQEIKDYKKLQSTYELLVVEHQKLELKSNDREKVLKKREDKTKQLLVKAKKDLADLKEKDKE